MPISTFFKYKNSCKGEFPNTVSIKGSLMQDLETGKTGNITSYANFGLANESIPVIREDEVCKRINSQIMTDVCTSNTQKS